MAGAGTPGDFSETVAHRDQPEGCPHCTPGGLAPAATPVRGPPQAHPGCRWAVGFFEACDFARAGETQAMWIYAWGEH